MIATLAGVVALVHPIRRLGLGSRRRAATALCGGVLTAVIGLLLPAAEVRITTPRTRLDEFAPAYQFNEVHTVRIAASPAAVYRAIQQVTAQEILFFRLLTWIRRGGRPGPESILNAPEAMPILDVATRTGFLTLANDPERELVIGTVVAAPPAPPGAAHRNVHTPADYRAIGGPGFAKATMNFHIAPDGNRTTFVSTETRVFATNDATRRRFAMYWRIIYPGSAIIRRSWLRAIRRRAEAGEGRDTIWTR